MPDSEKRRNKGEKSGEREKHERKRKEEEQKHGRTKIGY